MVSATVVGLVVFVLCVVIGIVLSVCATVLQALGKLVSLDF